MNHYINTAATDTARARTVGLNNLLPAPFPVLTVGSVSNQTFFFANNGSIESWSGAGDYQLRVTIGDVAAGPVGRIYKLTVGAGTAKDIPFDLDAAGLQDVLNRDTTVAAEGGVEVIQQGNGRFMIAYKALGAVTAITVSAALLTPNCTATITTLSTGMASVRQLLLLTLQQDIPFQSTAFTSTSSGGSQGWTGDIDLTSAAAIQFMRLSGKPVSQYLQAQTLLTVEVLDADGNAATYYQTPITLRALNYQVASPNSNVSMIQNFFARPNIVGLASNSSNATLLGGLTTSTGDYPVGSTVQCLFTNDVVALFIRKSTTNSQSVPFTVRPYDYNSSTNPYQWVLDRVTKQGVPCTWDGTMSKFVYMVAYGNANAVGLAVDQSGFSLPS